MNEQDEMFSRLWVDAVLTCRRQSEEGWECRVLFRQEGATWSDGISRHYERLTPAELLDVIVLELSDTLGI